MTTRREFLKLGALFVPAAAAAIVEPSRVYSFIWNNPIARPTVIHGGWKLYVDGVLAGEVVPGRIEFTLPPPVPRITAGVTLSAKFKGTRTTGATMPIKFVEYP